MTQKKESLLLLKNHLAFLRRFGVLVFWSIGVVGVDQVSSSSSASHLAKIVSHHLTILITLLVAKTCLLRHHAAALLSGCHGIILHGVVVVVVHTSPHTVVVAPILALPAHSAEILVPVLRAFPWINHIAGASHISHIIVIIVSLHHHVWVLPLLLLIHATADGSRRSVKIQTLCNCLQTLLERFRVQIFFLGLRRSIQVFLKTLGHVRQLCGGCISIGSHLLDHFENTKNHLSPVRKIRVGLPTTGKVSVQKGLLLCLSICSGRTTIGSSLLLTTRMVGTSGCIEVSRHLIGPCVWLGDGPSLSARAIQSTSGATGETKVVVATSGSSSNASTSTGGPIVRRDPRLLLLLILTRLRSLHGTGIHRSCVRRTTQNALLTKAELLISQRAPSKGPQHCILLLLLKVIHAG
mmetsp:Transcript_26280/g.72551  ORF Transcript_26280/g.72551 Transcript_26280/m.72551 type:complete len:409 (-) Transcript_26280:475-1701(-)